MARVKSTETLFAANTERTAGAAATRAAIDVRECDGGVITFRIRNGGALGAACVCTVMVSHDAGATPATASTGDASTWKQIFQFGGGTGSGAITSQSFDFGPAVKHIQVEFDGNTTNSAFVEAIASLVDYEG